MVDVRVLTLVILVTALVALIAAICIFVQVRDLMDDLDQWLDQHNSDSTANSSDRKEDPNE
ncbi:MAG: hypothetical protein UHD09_02260 [Bifidobacterium sp.]|nr:hypothetical protein [Bifidobacterium sp.]